MKSVDIDHLTTCFLAEGLDGISADLNSCPTEDNQRLKLLDSIRQKTGSVYIVDHLLDRMHEIHEACIAESLGCANGDEEMLMYANVTSYNLAANLADCWTDAEEPRTVKHFNAGIVAAKRCLDLRKQLNKPPAAMAMAFFILGVHEYSLQQYSTAETSWSSKLENELLKLEPNREDSAETTADLDVLLSHGLIALARWSQGIEDGSNFEESLHRLEAERSEDKKNDVELFLNELRLLKDKHGPF